MSTLMILHAIAGVISVVCGINALFSRKGSLYHRIAGRVFLVATVVLVLLTAAQAYWHPDAFRSLGLLFTVFIGYLVITSWRAITNRSFQVSWPDYLAMAVVFLVSLACYLLAYIAVTSGDGTLEGLSPGPYFFFGSVALIAALLDIRLISLGGLSEKRRMPRHIWRIGFALYMATASMFTGPGAVLFPDYVRQTGYLIIPEVLVAIGVLSWIWRQMR